MRILMLTDRFPPEVRSAAHLFHELAREFQSRAHEVAVVTKAPRQYVANGGRSDTALGWEDVGGVPTLRVLGFPIAGYHPIVRGLDHLTLGWSVRRASGRWSKADVVLVYSPHLPLACPQGRNMPAGSGYPLSSNLFEYGTVPIYVTMGRVHRAPLVHDDGSVGSHEVFVLRYTYDERIEDGFYAARALEALAGYLADPAALSGAASG